MSDTWLELAEREDVASLVVPWDVGSAKRLGEHASRRRFYRLRPAADRELRVPSLVLVLYEPDDTEGVEQYRRTAEWFAEAGVHVPRIAALSGGALIVEDGGDRLLADEPGEGIVRYYLAAAELLLELQRQGRAADAPNPDWALDAERLRNELDFTEAHALREWLGGESSGGRREKAFDRLAAAVAALPIVVCHRDFHSRNILVSDDTLMVLDFQDIMAGPHLYDLASLLHDDYRDVPAECASAALATYWARGAVELETTPVAEVPDEPSALPPAARQSFLLTAAQRSLKALGTFGYQVTVAGNEGYARFAGRTWDHGRRALEALGWHDLVEELAPFEQLRG